MNLQNFQSGKFKPFVFAKPGSNQNETRGIGIGLSTASILCDFLCGNLKFKTKKGEGTTSKFSIATLKDLTNKFDIR